VESLILFIQTCARQRGRHFARRHTISAFGHGVSHIFDIDDSSAFDRAAALIVGLLRRNRFIIVESKGVMVGEVGGGGLGIDLQVGVQALELACMTLEGARVGGDLGLCCTTRNLSACSLRMLARAMAMSLRRACMLC
jgi:hypothetical protein